VGLQDLLPDEQASPKQIEILRTVTGERRLRLAEQRYWSARRPNSYWPRFPR